MDMKDIRRVIQMMRDNELTDFKLEDEGFSISIKRHHQREQVVVAAPAAPAAPAASVAAAPVAPAEAPTAPAAADEGLVEIKSPIVGTFYRKPSPEADTFVDIGSDVTEESTVCIVEAMKVMNEIKADVKGRIKKILVDDATPVQFGQALFLVEPS